MSAANRDRGRRAEVAVVNYLRANGYPDARRYLAGDGRQPGDIDWHPLIAVEVKDRKSSSWPSWCRQAVAEAREGMVPVVVRRTRGTPDVGLWECRTPEQEMVDVFGAVHYWCPDDMVRVARPGGRYWDFWQPRPFGDFVRLVREGEGR